MPTSLAKILDELETLAQYKGAWGALLREQALLRSRLEELRAREARLDDVLVVAIVGGSGVGKSTLLNAIAGDEIAKTSPFRPCTTEATVYHPPGATLPFGGWNCVARSALENLAIVDTPDTDSIALEHRDRTVEVLRQCDLILLCGSAEKYLDEATWELLRPLQGERTMVCVETKAGAEGGIREHWLAHMEEQGFQVAGYFRVQALHSMDRKLRGAEASQEELDFPRLEKFFTQELTRERIAKIKRSNASGLLGKTVRDMHARLAPSQGTLAALEAQLDEAAKTLYAQCADSAEVRLFQEGHLWHLALGREMSLRSKGLVGGFFRALETLRSLPARLSGLLPRWGGNAESRGNAAVFAENLFAIEIAALGEEAAAHHRAKHSAIRLAMLRAGFESPGGNESEQAAAVEFQGAIVRSLHETMRGAAHEAVVKRARMLGSWPLALLMDAPLVAFTAYAAWIFTRDYFGQTDMPADFVQNTLIMFCLILLLELLALSFLVRFLAWRARRAALKAFRLGFSSSDQAFVEEYAQLALVISMIGKLATLNQNLLEMR